jgi:uncharacterized protein YfdQ (DUF2303 family)
MDNLEIKNSETQAIVELASSIKPCDLVSESRPGHIKHYALPPGWESETYDDEHLLPAPYRKKGNATLNDQDSFIEYINRHSIPDLTTIYCKADYLKSEVAFTCIINDHGSQPDGQQWQDHRAMYKPTFSEEWNRWIEKNKQPLSQLQMAMFIEENLQDIAAAEGYPTGQQLLEMATSFQANQDMRFKSAIRLQNGGVNMSFVQDDDNQTLSQMKLFEKIAIGIPVFWNGDAYQITARLRYRVKEGSLIFWYELIRNDKVLEDATKNMINKIKIATGVPLFFGTAN